MTLTLISRNVEARLREQAKWNELEVGIRLRRASIAVMLEWGEQEVKEPLVITAQSHGGFRGT